MIIGETIGGETGRGVGSLLPWIQHRRTESAADPGLGHGVGSLYGGSRTSVQGSLLRWIQDWGGDLNLFCGGHSDGQAPPVMLKWKGGKHVSSRVKKKGSHYSTRQSKLNR